MDYKKILLNKLLDRYEKSKSIYEQTNRRIILKMKDIKEYDIENFESKKIFHDIINELKNENIIDYSWELYETGNILKEIWLNKDNEEKAYTIESKIVKEQQKGNRIKNLNK